MDQYTNLFGGRWKYTEDHSEIPEKVRKRMQKWVQLSFDKEEVVVACWRPGIFTSCREFVIAVQDRLMAHKNDRRTENLFFSDITNIELTFTKNIAVYAGGSKIGLFGFIGLPSRRLIRRLHSRLNEYWMSVKRGTRG